MFVVVGYLRNEQGIGNVIISWDNICICVCMCMCMWYFPIQEGERCLRERLTSQMVKLVVQKSTSWFWWGWIGLHRYRLGFSWLQAPKASLKVKTKSTRSPPTPSLSIWNILTCHVSPFEMSTYWVHYNFSLIDYIR